MTADSALNFILSDFGIPSMPAQPAVNFILVIIQNTIKIYYRYEYNEAMK